MNLKKLSLIIALILPFVFFSILGLLIWTTSVVFNPAYDFVFTSNFNYSSNLRYEVDNSQLTLKDIKTRFDQIDKNIPEIPSLETTEALEEYLENQGYKLFLYKIKTDEVKEIRFSETQNWKINPEETSPDGFIIKTDNSFGSFFGSSYSSPYLYKNNLSKSLNTKLDYDFRFLGWVTN